MMRVAQQQPVEAEQQPTKDKEEVEVVVIPSFIRTIKLMTEPGVSCDWGNKCIDPIDHAVCTFKNQEDVCLQCILEPDRREVHCQGCGKSLGLYTGSVSDDDDITIICFDCEKDLRQNAYKLETQYQDQWHATKKAKIDKLLLK